MKEVMTIGSLGWITYRYCFTIIMEDNAIKIHVPFNRITIPLEFIEKVLSVSDWGTALKIIHHYDKAPKKICFVSTDWNAWFEAFESKGISISDPEQLRFSDTSFLKWCKKASLIVGVLGVVAASGAVIALIINLILYGP